MLKHASYSGDPGTHAATPETLYPRRVSAENGYTPSGYLRKPNIRSIDSVQIEARNDRLANTRSGQKWL